MQYLLSIDDVIVSHFTCFTIKSSYKAKMAYIFDVNHFLMPQTGIEPVREISPAGF